MSPTGSVVDRDPFQEQVVHQCAIIQIGAIFSIVMMNTSTKENQPEKHVVFVADQIFN